MQRLQLSCARSVRAHRSEMPLQQQKQQQTRSIRFRPCIDIHKGKVKQIVGSTLQDASQSSLVVNFESKKSAGDYAAMYKEDDLPGGHVIMLGADPLSIEAALEALHAYPGGLQIGGGVNLENAESYLNAGASHVIVTSFVFKDGKVDMEKLRRLVNLVGKERLVLDLSCRKKDGQYMVVTDRWQKFSNLPVTEETLAGLAESADEFLVHGVDVEGKRLGIDEELVELLGKASPIPVTYAGGVASMEHLEVVETAGCGRVDFTIGSSLDIFGGQLSYKDVVSWCRLSKNGGSSNDVTVCPRCNSSETKFCYLNNKKETQPRYKCLACNRKFTKGGRIRDVPARKSGGSGGGRRGRKVNGAMSAAASAAVKIIVNGRRRRTMRQVKRRIAREEEEDEEDEDEDVSDESYEEEDDEEDDDDAVDSASEVEDVVLLPPTVKSNKRKRPPSPVRQPTSDSGAEKQALVEDPKQQPHKEVGSGMNWQLRLAFEKIKRAILDGYASIVYT